MSGIPRVRYRPERTDVDVEPFGAVATILLENRLQLAPKAIGLLHTKTLAEERGLERGEPDAISVWVRVVWADKSETLGFVSIPDAELVWACYPEVTAWFSRCLGGHISPNRNARTV